MKGYPSQSILRGITILIVALLWMLVSPITAFFWTLFLIWAAFKLDPRIIGIGAITLLIMIPIALSTVLYEWIAEQLAVYVFYLLCITVMLQILELRRGLDNDDTKEKPLLTNTTSAKKRVIEVKKVRKPRVI